MFATIWNTLLFHPFLNILLAAAHLFGDNLGWAVIFIAILIRLILIPSVKSQTEMTRKMSSLKPELEKLQKKYGNNQQVLAQEQMKLYKRVGYNPLGCLGSFLPQILVLYAIIQVINVTSKINPDSHQIEIATNTIYPFLRDWLGYVIRDGKTILPSGFTTFLSLDLTSNFSTIAKAQGYFAPKAIIFFVIAILVGVVQYVSTKFMQHMQGQTTPAKKKDTKKGEVSPEDMQAQMMGSMNLLFPFMTFFITLTTPAVLGVYWLAQSVMLVAQYFIIDLEKSKEATKLFLKRKSKK